jgi:hypothetical protein
MLPLREREGGNPLLVEYLIDRYSKNACKKSTSIARRKRKWWIRSRHGRLLASAELARKDAQRSRFLTHHLLPTVRQVPKTRRAGSP